MLGFFLVAGGAYSVTNWIGRPERRLVGEKASPRRFRTSRSLRSLFRRRTNQLYPGGAGDVVLTITNPNPYPVTLTGVTLPLSTSYAGGLHWPGTRSCSARVHRPIERRRLEFLEPRSE